MERPGGVGLAAYERSATTGDAEVVLLVHGYPDTHAMWDPVAERLAIDHHVVAYDVRGAGASSVPSRRDQYRLNELVADLVAVADEVSPDRPLHLVGHDWGSIQSWAAVTDPSVAQRFATFTSISGPSLDHASAWAADRLREGPTGWWKLARQAQRSWYVAAFQTPAADVAWRTVLARRWPATMARSTGGATDDRWPGPTLADDAVHGLELYRANRRGSGGRPAATPTEVAVQLLVARHDPFVTAALLDGIEALAPDLTRVDLEGGHWLPRSHPADVADRIAGHIASHPSTV